MMFRSGERRYRRSEGDAATAGAIPNVHQMSAGKLMPDGIAHDPIAQLTVGLSAGGSVIAASVKTSHGGMRNAGTRTNVAEHPGDGFGKEVYRWPVVYDGVIPFVI